MNDKVDSSSNYLKIDLHLHTQFSDDSLINIKKIPKWAKKKGLNGFAVTDHSTLKGYRYLNKQETDLLIIPGMEIETEYGEILALFISEEISTKTDDYFEIIDDVKEKNGIVVIPHPFDRFRSNRLKINLLSNKDITDTISGVEIINSRIIIKGDINKAREFQAKYNLFESGGSDAHLPWEIGNGYTLISSFSNSEKLSLDELKKILLSGKSKGMGKRSNPVVHMITVSTKIKNQIFRKIND